MSDRSIKPTDKRVNDKNRTWYEVDKFEMGDVG